MFNVILHTKLKRVRMFLFLQQGPQGEAGDAGVPGKPGVKGLQGQTVCKHKVYTKQMRLTNSTRRQIYQQINFC